MRLRAYFISKRGYRLNYQHTLPKQFFDKIFSTSESNLEKITSKSVFVCFLLPNRKYIIRKYISWAKVSFSVRFFFSDCLELLLCNF